MSTRGCAILGVIALLTTLTSGCATSTDGNAGFVQDFIRQVLAAYLF
jgi:hypothetical protein